MRGTQPGGYWVPFWDAGVEDTAASSVYSTAVAVFLGIPIPKVVAALAGGITYFRCRKQRHGRYRTRVLDAHGYALSKYAGEGHLCSQA